MKDSEETAGLCASCKHARTIESAKGSEFWLCRLSETDTRFAKYPRLPVQRCAGYARQDGRDEGDPGVISP